MKNYKLTQYQPKSQILFHKNISPHDLYIMTLILCYAYGLKNGWHYFCTGVRLQDFISFIFYIIPSYYSISKNYLFLHRCKRGKLKDFISFLFYIIASYYSISKALYDMNVRNLRISSRIHKSIPNHKDSKSFPAILWKL